MKDWPIAALWVFFYCGAIARGAALYWLGRGLRRADKRGYAQRPGVIRAEATVRRWGPIAVTLSFLTVGVQSAINIAAGALRMPGRRFTPALLVGGAIWATIYVTVGMAVIYAFLGRLSWPILLAAALGVAMIVGGTSYARRRLRLRTPDHH